MLAHTDVVFRDLQYSPALSQVISKKLARLSRLSETITRTRVVLDKPHKRQNKGEVFRASIEMAVKGAPFTVVQDGTSAHLAVRDAFNAAERKLMSTLKKQHFH